MRAVRVCLFANYLLLSFLLLCKKEHTKEDIPVHLPKDFDRYRYIYIYIRSAYRLFLNLFSCWYSFMLPNC